MENKKISMDGFIDSLKLKDGTKAEFKAINFMYNNNFQGQEVVPTYKWKLSPQYLSLPKDEKAKIDIGLSVLGIVFGPVGYLIKGLFLKGFILIIPAIILTMIVPENTMWEAITENILQLFYIIYCGMMLKRDYFYKKVLKNCELKPMLENNEVDFSTSTENLTQIIDNNILRRKRIWIALLWIFILIIGTIYAIVKLI